MKNGHWPAVKEVTIGPVTIGGKRPLALIAGPCVIESAELCQDVAKYLQNLTDSFHIPFIFKSSYDKANRTSGQSFRGPGLVKGLEVLGRIKEDLGIPVLSDVHSVEEVKPAAQVLDVLQIPAFLCRQTDLVQAVARSGKAVNVKKGQFLAPWDMRYLIEKVVSCGNRSLLLTERGTSFGYNNLVVDMRSLVIMRQLGYPVVFDVTHSLQLPGALAGSSGGQREFVPFLARAAVALGVDGLFMEVHPQPEKALCDGPNSLPLGELASLLKELKEIDRLVKGISLS
ncbi:MAG: 3-deoxy-8-phosphooctulonate synthase [Thermodesulfobacteriota bacterium]